MATLAGGSPKAAASMLAALGPGWHAEPMRRLSGADDKAAAAAAGCCAAAVELLNAVVMPLEAAAERAAADKAAAAPSFGPLTGAKEMLRVAGELKSAMGVAKRALVKAWSRSEAALAARLKAASDNFPNWREVMAPRGHGGHGHSHGGKPCDGNHGHSHGSATGGHGHSHGGEPCDGNHGHSHGSADGEGHGHSHGGKPCDGDHGHSHGSANGGGHGHSHGGEPCDGGHSHGSANTGHGHSHGGKPCDGQHGEEEEACWACGATSGTVEGGVLKSCARCRVAKYCSAACQKANWKLHKPNCVPATDPAAVA